VRPSSPLASVESDGPGLFSLDGSVAIVTGASGGIGGAIARELAARGGRVALVSTSLERAQSAARRIDGETIALAGSVERVEDAQRLIEDTLACWGAVHILINAAGVIVRTASRDLAERDWDRVLDTNLKGTFNMCQSAARLALIPSGRGCVLNVSSARALVGTTGGYAAYAASKAGVNGLTRQLAAEWAPYGIRVNAIAPATVDTPLAEDVLRNSGRREAIVARIPLGRLATPADIVGPAIFLCSRGASYITGQVLYIDGGFTTWQ